MTALHAAALGLVRDWSAPDAEQEALRRRFVGQLEAHDDALDRGGPAEHLTASAMILDRAGERACLVLHRKARLWLQTGGHIEASDADLPSAALREAREESGIDDLVVDPEPVRLSRHAVPFCGGPHAHHLDVQFLVVANEDASTQVSEESDDVRWFDADDPPEPTDDEVRALLTAARRRLRGIPRP